jgi:hypothetical protein
METSPKTNSLVAPNSNPTKSAALIMWWMEKMTERQYKQATAQSTPTDRYNSVSDW